MDRSTIPQDTQTRFRPPKPSDRQTITNTTIRYLGSHNAAGTRHQRTSLPLSGNQSHSLLTRMSASPLPDGSRNTRRTVHQVSDKFPALGDGWDTRESARMLCRGCRILKTPPQYKYTRNGPGVRAASQYKTTVPHLTHQNSPEQK